MGDDYGGTPYHESIKGFSDGCFAYGVEVRCGFVEDEDWSVFEDGSGDCDALSLTAGELHAALAYEGVVSVGKGFDEVGGVGLSGGLFHLFVGGMFDDLDECFRGWCR